LKSEYVELEKHMQGAIEMHKMMYEDLRSMSDKHFRKIMELTSIIEELRVSLRSEIGLKNKFKRQLEEKTVECKEFMERLRVKIAELEMEEKAHQQQIKKNHDLDYIIE